MIKFDENLMVGNAFDALCPSQGIGAILNVANDLCRKTVEQVEYAQIGLIDGPGNLQSAYIAAILTLDMLLERHKKVLVYCHGGESRSVAVAIMYINTMYMINKLMKRHAYEAYPISRKFTEWVDILSELHDVDVPQPHNAHIEAYNNIDWQLLKKLLE